MRDKTTCWILLENGIFKELGWQLHTKNREKEKRQTKEPRERLQAVNHEFKTLPGQQTGYW